MNGGLGDDTYVVDNAGDAVLETSASGGADTVESSVTFTLGSNVEDLILTGAGAINGTGNALANELTRNAAANVLNGGTGADTMAGGAGVDTYFVENAGDTLVETSDAAIDQVFSSVTFTLAAFVENLTLSGVAAIDGTGNALANQIVGNAAANQIDGGIGADTMTGGGGNDTYFVDAAGDQVVEAAGGGTDLVMSAIGHTLGANVENLILTGAGSFDANGNGLANQITGNSGNNILDGGAGADTLDGGDGNDSYFVDNAGDQVVETSAGGGVDQVNSSVSFTLGTNVENLTLTGTAALNGTGNDGANAIIGNSGANTLNGGDGSDSLSGGAGSDIYEFTTALGAGNIDAVLDFNTAADTIRLGGGSGQPFAALATARRRGRLPKWQRRDRRRRPRPLQQRYRGLLYDADGVGGTAAVSSRRSIRAWR
jgi:Ca2+-binding RTX toxin-like protein